jgi:hypothetical protein
MCINDKWVALPWNQHKPQPSVGDIDVVINEEMDAEIAMVFYQLQRFGCDSWYRSDMFATLLDDTADDMQEKEKEAIVNLETVLA